MAKEKQLIRFDWAIKNIFKKKKELDILEDFLSDLLQKKLKIEELIDSESIKETVIKSLLIKFSIPDIQK